MNRRDFIKFFTCSTCGFILPSCASVPITERKQLSFIPEATLNRQAASMYEKVKEKTKLSSDTKTLNNIKEIGNRIETAVSKYFYSQNLPDPTSNFQWEYILIDNDKIKNAWCMPGG